METALIKRHPQAAQHNILVRAPLKMNLHEARLFALALGCIRKGDNTLPEIRIRFEDAFPGESGSAYEAADKATRGLMAKMVQLQTIHGRSKVTERYSIFSYLKLDSGTRLITGWFDERIAPYLLNLVDHFTTVEIETLLTLKSPHTQRVFWLLKSYAHQGGYEVDLTAFRKQLLGEDHLSHYPSYFDFKRFILVPVLQEIHAAGWPVEVTEIKPGLRKVIGLRFVLPEYVEPHQLARKAKETVVKQAKEAKKKSAVKPPAASEAAPLRLPAWLVGNTTRNGNTQYERLVKQFELPPAEARRLIEALATEADFLRLTKTMHAVLTPKAGEPPIVSKGAVLKARLEKISKAEQ